MASIIYGDLEFFFDSKDEAKQIETQVVDQLVKDGVYRLSLMNIDETTGRLDGSMSHLIITRGVPVIFKY